MRSSEPQDASDCVLGVFGKLSTTRKEGCYGLGSMIVWTWGPIFLKY
jgi:hypothetical protein